MAPRSTFDVRLTLTPAALDVLLARLNVDDDVCREMRRAVEQCVQYQRVVRECAESGMALIPRLEVVRSAEKLVPLPGDKK